ncbi:hypothetical protein ACTXT7_011278 [Hymenolepis weldensis]
MMVKILGYPPNPAELDSHHHRIDRVQQYSEKRTHITATNADLANLSNFRRRDSSGAVQGDDPPLSGGRHISGLLGRQYDSLSEMADLSDGSQEQQQLADAGQAFGEKSGFSASQCYIPNGKLRKYEDGFRQTQTQTSREISSLVNYYFNAQIRFPSPLNICLYK